MSLFIGLVEYDRLLGPDARVARCLASLFDPVLYPRAVNFVQLSQEEIGLLSAVSRQRCNEALHELERAGLLRIEFGGVTVLDLPGLRGYAAPKRRRAGCARARSRRAPDRAQRSDAPARAKPAASAEAAFWARPAPSG